VIFGITVFTNLSWSSEERLDKAYSYYKTGNIEKAIEELKQAINENPQDGFAHLCLARCYLKQGNEKEAMARFSDAFKFGEKDPRIHRYLGELAEGFGDWERAIDSYSMVIHLSPDDPIAYLDLARVYVKGTGEFSKAKKVLRFVLNQNPPKDIMIKAYLLLAGASKETSEQEEYYKKVLEIDPGNPLAKTMLEFIKKGEEYKKNIAISSEAQKHYAKAEKLYGERKFEKAIEQYKKAIDLEPRFAKAYLYLGDCYWVMGRYDKAFPYFKKATEIDPKNPQAWAFLGDLYYKFGRHESAYECYKIAVDLDAEYHNAVAKLKIVEELMERKRQQARNK
jgi:tetratricopeptide (TPR) repeat protein